ncbi:RanGTP-binding protein-domain-containing protein [Echria macrotheca]|uniref:RanGTP-binding protein-domain-containing protein n=1 Tax=Echria macrotheca TaxID=438768 RepID=A0AAJ0BJY9_9PEZI|nr:RanGTP-binding protein-domain-containing protein [Echria macrotheca]
MDMLLSRIANQAVNLAVKSAVIYASDHAYRQYNRLLKTVNDPSIHAELKALQKTLENKVKILSPAIDLIEFKSGRGNVFLESALPLAKSLHREIVRLGKQLDDAATSEEALRQAAGGQASMSAGRHAELQLILKEVKTLIARIDRDIPLIHLAITNSGEKMNSALSPGISPSRMMQASWLLNYADLQFAHDPSRPVQVGPSFTLSLYMLFLGHSTAKASAETDGTLGSPELAGGQVPAEEPPYGLGEGERKPIWQEVMHKARVRLFRTPIGWTFERARGYCPPGSPDLTVAEKYSATSATETLTQPEHYSYHLEIIEDLDDGRLHEEGSGTGVFDDITLAGIRESVPVHQIAKIFYTDTGRLLSIKGTGDGDNSPVLLLKRDAEARTPTSLRQEWHEDASDGQSEPDDQWEVDRQLQEETQLARSTTVSSKETRKSSLPAHLDPEWLALEVFFEDDDDQTSEDECDEDEKANTSDSGADISTVAVVDSKLGSNLEGQAPESDLVAQLQTITLGIDSPGPAVSHLPSGDVERVCTDTTESRIARSPFGSVVTSLSLLEMLIRLTSLQEFQQTPHLAIPDHVLTFFLDDTSTTGLDGEAHWALRNEAKRRVGFDPYTDTPPK